MVHKIKQVDVGEFGPIYEGIAGQEAINFLIENKSGEVPGAMNREGLGNIDFVYGQEGEQGYGLAHILEYHPEILPYLVEIIEYGEIFKQAKDRVLVLKKVSEGKGVAVIRLDWNGTRKQWLVTAF